MLSVDCGFFIHYYLHLQLCVQSVVYRVSVKSLYNFKNLLQRQTKKQVSENCYEMRRGYLSFSFFASFVGVNTITISKSLFLVTIVVVYEIE